jgi:hypothetical protein
MFCSGRYETRKKMLPPSTQKLQDLSRSGRLPVEIIWTSGHGNKLVPDSAQRHEGQQIQLNAMKTNKFFEAICNMTSSEGANCQQLLGLVKTWQGRICKTDS